MRWPLSPQLRHCSTGIPYGLQDLRRSSPAVADAHHALHGTQVNQLGHVERCTSSSDLRRHGSQFIVDPAADARRCTAAFSSVFRHRGAMTDSKEEMDQKLDFNKFKGAGWKKIVFGKHPLHLESAVEISEMVQPV